MDKNIKCPTCNTTIIPSADLLRTSKTQRSKLKLARAYDSKTKEQETSTGSERTSPPELIKSNIKGPSVIESLIAPAVRGNAASRANVVMAVTGQNVAKKTRRIPWALIVFLLLAPLAALLRYSGYTRLGPLMSRASIEAIADYGPYLLLLIHAVIVIMAFGDSVMEGILCLLVPLFSFYYIISHNDRTMFRAFIAIIIIFLALDTYNFTTKHGERTYRKVKLWIETASLN